MAVVGQSVAVTALLSVLSWQRLGYLALGGWYLTGLAVDGLAVAALAPVSAFLFALVVGSGWCVFWWRWVALVGAGRRKQRG